MIQRRTANVARPNTDLVISLMILLAEWERISQLKCSYESYDNEISHALIVILHVEHRLIGAPSLSLKVLPTTIVLVGF
jgi:hypothetical protein